MLPQSPQKLKISLDQKSNLLFSFMQHVEHSEQCPRPIKAYEIFDEYIK